MSCPRVSCGVEYPHINEICNTLSISAKTGYDFIIVPLVHPRYTREHLDGKAKDRKCAFTRSDLLLSSANWSSLIVGNLSKKSSILCESNVWSVRANHEAILKQELTYASHLGLPSVMVNLTSERCVNLARIIHNKVVEGVGYQIWVRVSMRCLNDDAKQFRSDESENDLEVDTWRWWNKFHTLANMERRIYLALEITENISEKEILDRWLGEPIKCAILPTKLFLTNKKGFPVLSTRHQSFVKKLHKLHAQFIISGALRHGHLKLYQQYLDFILKMNPQTNLPVDDPHNPVMDFAKGYEDYLQSPLQPLMDNLESQTYEVFEKDPIKYSQYEKAMIQALKDRVSEKDKDKKEIVLMILGAGRGPLVRGALKASQISGRKVRIFAIDKNPNAALTLFAHKEESWGDQVEVFCCDMRDWTPPEKADIIVSELLGSFGDNELSPECIDGAMRFLKDDGICIPDSYTSYISPVQSSKLYNEVRSSRDKDKPPVSAWETPYVVYLQNKTQLAPSQALFSFKHPNRANPIDNRRFKSLQFKMSIDSVIHGIAGYFEATLYANVKLSIRPENHSQGMFSWFPIFFPITTPICVSAGETVECSFWRCSNARQVWYEWALHGKRASLGIHNPNGRSYTIGL